MLGLTSDEKKVILFFLAALAVGSAVLFYKRTHPSFAPGLREMTAALPAPRDSVAADSLAPPAPAAAAPRPRLDKATMLGMSKINLNTAGQQALERLPNVGPAMAKRILEYRNKSGGFRNLSELSKIKGIGPKRLAQLKDHVTIDR